MGSVGLVERIATLAGRVGWRGSPRARRSPHQVRAVRLADRLREDLRTRHPEVAWLGFVPRTLSVVLRVDDQESPVPLARLLQRAEVFPDAFERLVDQLIEEVRAVGGEREMPPSLEQVARDLVPQLRARGDTLPTVARFGDRVPCSVPFSADLDLAIAIDDGDELALLPRGLARRWGRAAGDLLSVAITNLRRHGIPDLTLRARGDAILLDSGDGLDAARLCLFDLSRCEGHHFAVPDRDLLWFGDEEAASMHRLASRVRALYSSARHPISPHVYRVVAGTLVRVDAADG